MIPLFGKPFYLILSFLNDSTQIFSNKKLETIILNFLIFIKQKNTPNFGLQNMKTGKFLNNKSAINIFFICDGIVLLLHLHPSINSMSKKSVAIV